MISDLLLDRRGDEFHVLRTEAMHAFGGVKSSAMFIEKSCTVAKTYAPRLSTGRADNQLTTQSFLIVSLSSIGVEMKPTAEMPSPLQAHLGYWLRFVSNHVSHAFARKLMARDVTVAEWVFLRELHERDSVAPSELAARLGMTRGAISKLADRLVAKTLVARTAGRSDRRYQSLTLTRSGRALVPKLARLADQNDQEFFGDLPRAERQMIEKAMKEIVRRHAMKAIPIG
jgi:DNA-binding MarR family transcriptional regulator